ncbi:hypothetical protein EJ03DRAFT_354240 [Teratosphaeria nubilosa]|uniref:Uncharacterized protein n=1 Tax=Teratosphaeria nubilosa TaxID=161662 RepID=A0A6G1L113_9PEZI|nr:hypothetical protein EJ03DRAFT_354240 [Teratosphaeria nubilosa]
MATIINKTKTCRKDNHDHPWVTSGILVIERCEKFCQFCEGADVDHDWKHAWFLRRHVTTVHCKPGAKYEHVKVADKWTGAPGTQIPKGIRKDGSPKKRPPPRANTSRAAKKRAVRSLQRRDSDASSYSSSSSTDHSSPPPAGQAYMSAISDIMQSIEYSPFFPTNDIFSTTSSDEDDGGLFNNAAYADFAYPPQEDFDFGLMSDDDFNSVIVNTDARSPVVEPAVMVEPSRHARKVSNLSLKINEAVGTALNEGMTTLEVTDDLVGMVEEVTGRKVTLG